MKRSRTMSACPSWGFRSCSILVLSAGLNISAQAASASSAEETAAQSAETDSSADDSAAQLPTVRVIGRAAPVPEDADDRYQPTPDASTLRTTAPMQDIPQVVNVVPAQVIRDQRPRNLDDALINVSGITQSNTLAGTQDTILKRGFGGNRDGSIMHNGMPLIQGRGLNAAAESIEVLKGPSSLLYGIMDPGGVINVVSKKPQLQTHTTLGLAGSTFGANKNGLDESVDTTGSFGGQPLAYRLVVDHINEDYWRNFGTHRETLVAPSLAWYGESLKVVGWYEYRDFQYPFDRGTALDPATLRPIDIPATRRLDEPFNEMTGNSHLGQVAIDWQFSGDWAAHLDGSYDRESYDANQLRVNGINTTTGILTRSNDGTHGAVSTDGYGSIYIDGHVDLADMRHELQLGADGESRLIYRSDLLRQATTHPFSYLEPVYGLESPSQTVSPSDSDQTDRLHNHSGFFQDTLHLGTRWILVGAARYQVWDQVAGKGRPFKENTDTEGSKWLPRAGLVYKLTDTASLYGSYTQSLKPASTIAPLSTGVLLDSAVAPEEAKSWELGAKIDIPGNVTSTLALFNINKKNVLVSQFNDVTKLTDWRTSGAARSRGAEFDISGEINSRWSAIGSYAYVDAKTTEDPLYEGKQLWNAAKNTASLFAVYKVGPVFGVGRMRLGGGGHYVSARPGDSANSFVLPSYTTADAFATFDTTIEAHKVNFQLNVKNIANKVYYPSSVNTYFVAIGDARQVTLSGNVTF